MEFLHDFLDHTVGNTHDGSMGLVYLPTFFPLILMVNVGKYTSPMDPMDCE